MREILFKAKRTDTKEWVEGYPFPSKPGGELNRMTIFEDIPGGLIMAAVEIDPETLCEFTGLTDKNGVKIFECDVLSDEYGDTATVKYGERECGLYDVYGFTADGVSDWIYCDDILVTGNIHDEVTP